MYRKLLGKVTLGTIAFAGLATAGDVTLGQAGSTGLFLTNSLSLTCGELNCTDSARQRVFLHSLNSAPAATGSSVTLDSLFSTTLTASSGISATASSTRPVAASSTQAPDPEDSTMFVISDGKIVQRFESGWADVSTGDYVGGSGNVYSSSGINVPASSYSTNLQFSNPIVSPVFNLASTTIVVDPPSSKPAPDEKDSSNSSSSSSLVQSMMATPPVSAIIVPTPLSSNSESAKNQADSSAMTDGSTSAAGFSMAAAATANMNAPEPATDLLIGAGLIAAGVFARVKRSQGKR